MKQILLELAATNSSILGACVACVITIPFVVVLAVIWHKSTPKDNNQDMDEEEVIYDLGNFQLEFQRHAGGPWHAFMILGSHKSKLNIKPEESLKEVALASLRHVDVRTDLLNQ